MMEVVPWIYTDCYGYPRIVGKAIGRLALDIFQGYLPGGHNYRHHTSVNGCGG
jgi:hypothetical protein